jgi:hypothetical protein
VAPHFFETRVLGDWDSQLARQTHDPGTSEAALETIAAAYGAAL